MLVITYRTFKQYSEKLMARLPKAQGRVELVAVPDQNQQWNIKFLYSEFVLVVGPNEEFSWELRFGLYAKPDLTPIVLQGKEATLKKRLQKLGFLF
jgi:hypothetical protein